jgi:hypothetical protein
LAPNHTGQRDEFFMTAAEGGSEVELGDGQFRKAEPDTTFCISLIINF